MIDKESFIDETTMLEQLKNIPYKSLVPEVYEYGSFKLG